MSRTVKEINDEYDAAIRKINRKETIGLFFCCLGISVGACMWAVSFYATTAFAVK